MSQLEELLSIVDQQDRESALLKYARSLGIDVFSARTSGGRYNEEKLALSIYDALQGKKKSQTRNLRFLSVSIVLFLLGAAMIMMLPQIVKTIYQENFSPPPPTGNVLKAYDSSGKSIVEDGQPVLFEPMQGSYMEYDEKNKPSSESFYQNGQLIWKRKFDKQGRVIVEDKYLKH